jgi:hypothetical protein
MKHTIILATLIILSGCTYKADFKEVNKTCQELDAKYFFVVVPSLFGNSVASGCVEK